MPHTHYAQPVLTDTPGGTARGRLTYEVADSNIKDPAVPPALIEVGQHVLESQLHELKPNGEHPQQRIVSDDQCLNRYMLG